MKETEPQRSKLSCSRSEQAGSAGPKAQGQRAILTADSNPVPTHKPSLPPSLQPGPAASLSGLYSPKRLELVVDTIKSKTP